MAQHLTPQQAAAFRDCIRPMLNFVGRCRRRLERLGFDQNGALFRAVAKAYDALFALHVELHYASCTSGVYKADQDQPDVKATDQAQVPPSHSET
jgi:hypothetical protein